MTASAQQQAPAAGGTAQQQSAPAPAPASARAPARRSSTPARLRLARGAATAAALLTGIVATGTFDTNGVNAPPNVVAAQWVAAERTGVAIAEADLAAAESLAAQRAGEDADPSALVEHVREAAGQQARAGGNPGAADEVARQIAGAGLLGQQAVLQAATDPAAADAAYGEASELARSASTTSDNLAAEHATALATGSRSTLTAVVGGVATLLLAAILVWLALRTRRIVNVPLLVATAITGGLTYVSLNPAALPVTYDQQVSAAGQTATALEQVLSARSSMYAVALGLEAPVEQDVEQAGTALERLDLAEVQEGWTDVADSVEPLLAAEGSAGRLEVLAGSEEAFEASAQALRDRLDDELAPALDGLGTTATLTSGVALLLGLVAAGLAWTGVTRRLRDYR